MSKSKPKWVIHYVGNGPCEICGEEHNEYLAGLADIHTHGMNGFRHPEFSMVLDVGGEFAASVLNELGQRVADGESFAEKTVIEGLLTSPSGEDVPVHLAEIDNTLRVILPDEQYRYPDTDKDARYPYSMQMLPVENLLTDGAKDN